MGDLMVSNDFEVDLQQVLLSDYGMAGSGSVSSDEELCFKSALFADEDEGFNEDFNDEDGLNNNSYLEETSQRLLQPIKNENNDISLDGLDAGVYLPDEMYGANVPSSAACVESINEADMFCQFQQQQGYGAYQQPLLTAVGEDQPLEPLWDNMSASLLSLDSAHLCQSSSSQQEQHDMASDNVIQPPVCEVTTSTTGTFNCRPMPARICKSRLIVGSSIPDPLSRLEPNSPALSTDSSTCSDRLAVGHASTHFPSVDRLPSNDELVSMPFYKFKQLLDSPLISDDQKSKAKAIRKKGKNKSAAKHCRQRKVAMVEGLESDIASLEQQRLQLVQEKARLAAEINYWAKFSS